MVAQLKKNTNLSLVTNFNETTSETTKSFAGCVISTGTKIDGDFHAEGDMRLDGTITGNLSCGGRLVIGEQGKVEGKVLSKNANINGQVKGEIEIKETLILTSTAFINGDIRTKYIRVELGAIHNGACQVGLSA